MKWIGTILWSICYFILHVIYLRMCFMRLRLQESNTTYIRIFWEQQYKNRDS